MLAGARFAGDGQTSARRGSDRTVNRWPRRSSPDVASLAAPSRVSGYVRSHRKDLAASAREDSSFRCLSVTGPSGTFRRPLRATRSSLSAIAHRTRPQREGHFRQPAATQPSNLARLGTHAVEYKAGSCIGAQQLSRHFNLREVVKHLARAVQRDDVIDVHLLERCDRLSCAHNPPCKAQGGSRR